MTTRPVLRTLLAAAVASVAATPPAAVAQAPPAPGAFAITPSRRDLVARPPATLVPTRVSNTTTDAYAVRAFPVVLHQDVSGAFRFGETPRALNRARTILRVAPARFVLRPGQSRDVSLRWALLPRGARAAYLGVVFAGRPRRPGNRAVPIVSRLLSLNFLRRPGRIHTRAAFTALSAEQFGARILRFTPRVGNTGDVVAAPRQGRLVVRDADGRVVHATSWTGDVVLPGAQRDFPIDVARVLPAGTYTATATMRFGRRRARISRPFRLIGPNELPTPRVQVSGFAAHGDAGHPAHVSARVQSTGTAPAGLDLAVRLFRVTGGQADPRPVSTARVRYARLRPGSVRAIDLDISRELARGHYRAVARYADPTGTPQQITSDFAAIPRRGLLERTAIDLGRHTLLIVVLAALAVIVLLLFVLLRRQRRLEKQLRAAQALAGQDGDAGR